jgi:hypothetical protein
MANTSIPKIAPAIGVPKTEPKPALRPVRSNVRVSVAHARHTRNSADAAPERMPTAPARNVHLTR